MYIEWWGNKQQEKLMAVIYADDTFQTIESKTVPCRPYGQGADGYGRKIASQYMVRLNKTGPWRRVYHIQISNAGSVYVLVKKQMYFFRMDENLRLTGEWPKAA
jgi:hypothetical protein